MNIGVIRERGAFDRQVALTPAVVRRLTGLGHTVWVESGAGDGALFRDPERSELVAKTRRPTTIAQARLPRLPTIAGHGLDCTLEKCPDLARGVFTLRGGRP
jgi:hypothetical protein